MELFSVRIVGALHCQVSQVSRHSHAQPWLVLHLHAFLPVFRTPCGVALWCHIMVAKASVKNTPFRLNYGQNPSTPLGIIADTSVPGARIFAEGMRDSLREASKAMEQAQARQKQAFDEHHRHQEFKEGDMVLLRTTNLNFKGPNARKLLPKWIGPMKILKRVNELAYKLDLPKSMRSYHTFHTSLLKLYKSPVAKSQLTQFEEVEYPSPEVESIIEEKEKIVRTRKGKKRKPVATFLVKWKNLGPEHNKWEPLSSFSGKPELEDMIRAFRRSQEDL